MRTQKNAALFQQQQNLIICGQGETIRRHSNSDLWIGTVGLISCIGMLIKDQSGNLSLTHVDILTDLSFVKTEVKFMQGKLEVTLYENKTNCTDVITKIQDYLNSEGFQFRVIRIEKDGIFTNGDKTQVADSVIILNRIFISNVKPNHPLSNWNIQCGFDDPIAFQIDMYHRQLNCVIAPQKIMPITRYDAGKLSKQKNDLLPAVVHFISKGFPSEKEIREFLVSNPGDRRDYVNERHRLINEGERFRVFNHVLRGLFGLYEMNPDLKPSVKKMGVRMQSVAVKSLEVNPAVTKIQKEIAAEIEAIQKLTFTP